jgi:hypothetical protein
MSPSCHSRANTLMVATVVGLLASACSATAATCLGITSRSPCGRRCAIGFAEPRPNGHSPGFGAYEKDGQNEALLAELSRRTSRWAKRSGRDLCMHARR